MVTITDSKLIQGVKLVKFKSFSDERGEFRETFRSEWFPQMDWSCMQANRSDSGPNVLRGLHFHRRQTDYWLVVNGVIRVGLCDLRGSSSTMNAVQVLEMGDPNQLGLLVPPGVAHGFVTLSSATVTYLVNNYYDGTDEHGVAWDDPDLSVPWGVESPVVSSRDTSNPLFRDIPGHLRPI